MLKVNLVKMKSVLIVVTQAENAGAQKAVLKLADYLKDECKVKILYLYVKDRGYFEFVRENYDAEALIDSFSYIHLLQLFRVRKILEVFSIDIVVTYTHWSNIVIPIILLGKSVKLIANKRGALWNYKKVRFIESIVLKLTKISKVVCVSKSLMSEAISKQRIPAEKLIYIPNGTSIPFLRENQACCESKNLKVLFVGRLHEQKGIKFLLDGFNEVYKTRKDIDLLVCGGGALEGYVANYVKSNNLGNSVELLGNVSNVGEYYQSSDVIISTSLWEGFPNVLLEAASYRLPIIATSIDGNLDLITHLVNGYVIPPSSATAVRDAIFYFSENKAQFRSFADEQYKNVSLNFSDKIIQRKYIDLINEVIS